MNLTFLVMFSFLNGASAVQPTGAAGFQNMFRRFQSNLTEQQQLP